VSLGERTMRSRRFDLAVSCVCLALLGYFAWHALEGPRGYPYRDKLVADAAQLDARYVELETERSRLEHRVRLMRPDSVDPDFLDQLSRAELEVAGADEVVAFTGH